jgi:hypothetical protein
MKSAFSVGRTVDMLGKEKMETALEAKRDGHKTEGSTCLGVVTTV